MITGAFHTPNWLTHLLMLYVWGYVRSPNSSSNIKHLMPGGKKNRTRANKRPKSAKQPGRSAWRVSHLPVLRDQIISNFVIRYQVTSGGGFINFTAPELIQSVFVVLQMGTAVVSIVDSVRINYVELWAPPAAATSSVAYGGNTARLAWLNTGPFAGPARQSGVTDTSLSNEPAHVLLRPQRNGVTSMWQNFISDSSWQLEAQVETGAVLDISFSFTLQMLENGVNQNSPLSRTNTPQAGLVYMTELQHGGSAATLIPQCGNYIA